MLDKGEYFVIITKRGPIYRGHGDGPDGTCQHDHVKLENAITCSIKSATEDEA